MWFVGFFLSLLFIFEGLGFKLGHELSYYLVVLALLIFLIYEKIKGGEKKFKAPKTLVIIYGAFTVFLVVSTAFSVNIAQSAPGLLYYPALFLISLWSYNHKEDLETWLVDFLVGVSFSLIAFSLFGWFFPRTGYSLLYSPLNDHNNLGDFLLIPMITGTYLMTQNRKKGGLIILLISAPIFLLSFSRSAFTAYILTVITMFIFLAKKTKSFYKTVFLVFVVLGFFYFLPNVNLEKCCPVLNKFISHRDDLISHRDSFFISAARAIKDYPLTGVGFNNFEKASFRYNDIYLFWTRSSHNIFLDIASEIGLPALVAFIVLIYILLKKSRRNLAFFVFVGLLANFQLYYSFQIYTTIFVFFMLIGILFEDGNNKPFVFNRNWLLAISAIPLIIIQFGFVSKTFINLRNYRGALLFDPFNKKVYEKIIGDSMSKGDYRNVVFYSNLYERVYYSDMEVMDYLALVNLYHNEEKQALDKVMRTVLWNPYEGDFKYRIYKTYHLLERIEGKASANNYLDNLSKRINGMWEYGHTSFKDTINKAVSEINPPLYYQ